MADGQENTTRFLADLVRGDEAAADRLLPLVYDELRAIAASYFRGQAPRQTLQPTALVHEAYLRLIDQTSASRVMPNARAAAVPDPCSWRAAMIVSSGTAALRFRRRGAGAFAGLWAP